MALIKSISGIRGTVGGNAGEGLTPLDIVKFTSAYAALIRRISFVKSNRIIVGRDARVSGEMVRRLVCGTLMGMGFDVVDIGLASTPTTELAVTMAGACGGIILTASHNPKQWNALKLLNGQGEFLNAEEGQEVLRIAEAEAFEYAGIDRLGSYTEDLSYNEKHIERVLALDLVDVEAIRKAGFRVAIDCVNSVGGIILPQLLERLGVKHVRKLYCEPTGDFQHISPSLGPFTSYSSLQRVVFLFPYYWYTSVLSAIRPASEPGHKYFLKAKHDTQSSSFPWYNTDRFYGGTAHEN